MSRTPQRVTLVLAVAVLSAAAPALSQPALVSNVSRVDISQPDCFARAELVIRTAGLSRTGETQIARIGVAGGLTASVSCYALEDYSVVSVAVAGPEGEREYVGRGEKDRCGRPSHQGSGLRFCLSAELSES